MTTDVLIIDRRANLRPVARVASIVKCPSGRPTVDDVTGTGAVANMAAGDSPARSTENKERIR
jgi:hypothetical protein